MLLRFSTQERKSESPAIIAPAQHKQLQQQDCGFTGDWDKLSRLIMVWTRPKVSLIYYPLNVEETRLVIFTSGFHRATQADRKTAEPAAT